MPKGDEMKFRALEESVAFVLAMLAFNNVELIGFVSAAIYNLPIHLIVLFR
jgi:hypothetical protein